MGTNYYARVNECDCCGRFDELHICKSFVSFEAPRHWDEDGEVTLYPASWADWRAFLATAGATIRNEYGEVLTLDEFVAAVEATDPDGRRRQFDAMCEGWPDEVSDGPEVGKTWLDPDGFTFSGREFS